MSARSSAASFLRWREWLPFTVLYLVASGATIGLARMGASISLIWIANAVLIAWLAALPRRRWLFPLVACATAGCANTLAFGVGVGGLGLPLVAVAEATATVAVLRRWLGHDRYFETVPGVAKFLVTTVSVSTAAAVLAGPIAQAALGGSIAHHSFNWLAGHVLSTITLTPITMLVLDGKPGVARVGRPARGQCAWLLPVLLVSLVTFAQSRYPLLFAPLIPVMVATLQLGRVGAAGSIGILVIVSAALTSAGLGPIQLMDGDPVTRLQFLQFYLACAAGLALPVAALFEQRRTHLRDLRASAAGYRLLTEHSGDVLLHLGPDGTIRRAVGAVDGLIGRTEESMLGVNSVKFVHPNDKKRVIDTHARLLSDPTLTLTFDYRLITAAGVARWCETRARAIVSEDGRTVGTVSAIREIEQRKQAEAELRRAATTDPLTGLLNRRAFTAQMEQIDRTATNYLAVIDLDHFKTINDRFGHSVGDEALTLFARIARTALRQGDVIGRIGGEEFAVLLRRVDQASAEALCERLRQRIETTALQVGDAHVHVTASFGVCRIRPQDSPASVLAAADAALYRAKAAGRNCLKLAA